ncbi:MAG: phenylacetate-CoA oxygenase subunit PaaJ [Ignavibacteria bacterium]
MVKTIILTEQDIRTELSKITDPEIPVLTLVEMKVIRSVKVADEVVTVVLSPTFVGCPAMEYMKNEIRSRLAALGCKDVRIETTFSPPWSTDMLDEDAKEKLRAFGIAPPPKNDGALEAVLALPVACPFCHSTATHLESAFGPTLCKQIYYCDACRQSFERFKPV